MMLSEDVRGFFKRETIYGKKGDHVVLISYHGSVAIVENIRGERFSIRAAILTNSLKEKENQNGELPVHRKTDGVEEKPDKQLRGKKGNKVHRGFGTDSAPSLF
jgi:hypothetical protein